MRHPLKIGLSFGLTSGIITTLGLMMGLHSGTHSKLVVIGGILTIAIADAFSDALGIHISEESENIHSAREIWESTIFTFLFKFVAALTFIAPVIFFSLLIAMMVNIGWGLFWLGTLSFHMAKDQGVKPYLVITEHIGIAIIVMILTHFVGDWIGKIAG